MNTVKNTLLVLLAAAPLVAGCNNGLRVGPGCDDLGTDADARKLEAFLAAGARFEADTEALAAEVEATCASMAADLGITVPRATEDEVQVEVTCAALDAEIQAIIDAALPAGASLEVIYEPSVCSFDVDAMADCVAECDATVTADVEIECTEGRLVGSCSGSCTGECRVEGEVACDAECRGECTGSCSGTCYGTCEGTCSAMDSEGNCVGTCTGTCAGSCSGSCTGSCSGTCVADVSGSCEGECAGSCDVDFEGPRCEGQADVMADVECEAACDAELSIRAECTEPSLAIYTTATVDPAAQARLVALVETLQAHYPHLLSLQARLVRVAESGAQLVVTFEGAADAAGRFGLAASACFASATTGAIRAVGTIDVTLEVTVEVSASVSADATAG